MLKSPKFWKYLSSPWFYLSGLTGLALAFPLSYAVMSKLQKSQTKAVLTIIANVGRAISRFQLVEVETEMSLPHILYESTYTTKDFKSFTSLFHRFLKDSKDKQPKFPSVAVIAMPAPVINNKVMSIPELEWGELNGNDLVKEFNLQSGILLNDFEATAYSVLNLQNEDLLQINEGVKGIETEKFAVLAPGAGLGYCTIVPAPHHKGVMHYVWAGEGAHAGFSPINKDQCDYMFWAMYLLFTIKNILFLFYFFLL